MPEGYELREEIVATARRTTFRARHLGLDSLAALTILSPAVATDHEQLALVSDAVERASRLRHPQIVPVRGLGGEAGRYHVVEAPVDGEPLDVRGPLGPAEALHVVRQLADALSCAHECGVIHGALDPARVWIASDVPPRVLLSGFGFPGDVPRRYSAPEQLAGGTVDARSDVFVLGLLLYELLEGRPFFPGDDDPLLDAATQLLHPFSRIAPSGVHALDARMIRRSRSSRPPTMARVRDEIDACLVRLGETGAAARRPVPRDVPVRRHQVIAVDESLGEVVETVSTPALTPARSVAEQLLLAAGHRPRRSRRVVPIAAAAIATAGIAFAWYLVSGDDVAPAVPVRAAAPAARVEEPAAEPAVAAEAGLPVPPESANEPAPPAVAEAEPPVVAAVPAPAGPPRIESYRPRERDRVVMAEGAGMRFGARAAGESPSGGLAYVWSVDGKRVGQGPTWWFVAPSAATATAHSVEVRVSDPAGAMAPPVTWNVEVTPRVSEANARDWVERLAAAWQRRDLATLRLYGIGATDAAARAVRERLPREDHWITVANEAIRTDGRFASVAFDLVERDARGKIVSSASASYELEKRADGFLALRAR